MEGQMKINGKVLMTVFALLGQIFFAAGQDNWDLRKEKNGIKVFTANVPDSKIRAIKVVAEYDAAPQQVAAVVMDIGVATDWVTHLKSCTLIKRISKNELYYYAEVELPWPAANRDFVAHLTVRQDAGTRIVTIDGPAVPQIVPKKKGIVRINNSEGKWVITPMRNNHVKVEYTMHVDPGGSLPSWLINMFATDAPMQIFGNLRQELLRPEFRAPSVLVTTSPIQDSGVFQK
jgi:hypothetical protein